jgi:Ca2+-binding EF-hand superfamily protein
MAQVVAAMNQVDKQNYVRQKLKAACMTMCTTNGHSDWQKIFSVMDVDRNGKINFEELRKGTRINLHVPESVITDSDLRYIFSLIDLDRSGYLSFNELLGYIKHGDPREHIREEHMRLKRLSEMRRAAQLKIAKAGVRNDPDHIRSIFAKYDEDFSGEFSLLEFTNALRDLLGVKPWELTNQQIGQLFESLQRESAGPVHVQDFVDFIVEGRVDGIQKEVPSGNNVVKVRKRPPVPGQRRPTGKPHDFEYRYAKWLTKSTPSLSASFSSSTFGMAPRSRHAASKMSPSSSGWISQDIHDWDPERPVYTRG